MVDPRYGGASLWLTLTMVDPRYGGPWLWWTLAMVDPHYGGPSLWLADTHRQMDRSKNNDIAYRMGRWRHQNFTNPFTLALK